MGVEMRGHEDYCNDSVIGSTVEKSRRTKSIPSLGFGLRERGGERKRSCIAGRKKVRQAQGVAGQVLQDPQPLETWDSFVHTSLKSLS